MQWTCEYWQTPLVFPAQEPAQGAVLPRHRVVQQKPLLQTPAPHDESSEQPWPSLLLHTPVASQAPVHRPVGSSWPINATQAWLASQVRHGPAQSDAAQQASSAMHEVVFPTVHDFVMAGQP